MNTIPKRPRGRPPLYSEPLANIICSKIASGESVHAFAGANGIPVEDTIYRWIFEREDFAEKYARAREIQAERGAARINSRAEQALQMVLDKQLDPKLANAVVNAIRLEIDSFKWTAAKLLPKKYGDRIIHEGRVDSLVMNLSGTLADAMGAALKVVEVPRALEEGEKE